MGRLHVDDIKPVKWKVLQDISLQTENSGNSPTAASSVLGSRLASKLVRQHSVRETELTPEIVIINNGTLSRSCTEETERLGDSVEGEGGAGHLLTVQPTAPLIN